MCKNNIQGKKEIDEQEFPDYEPQRHPEYEPQEHPED